MTREEAEEAKETLLNAAWLGTDKDRKKVEKAVKIAVQAIEEQGKWKAVCPNCGTKMEVIGSMTEVTANVQNSKSPTRQHIYSYGQRA